VSHKAGVHHLGFDKAYLIAGCMGCCPVAAFVVAHPETVLSTTLFWLMGGARYRLTNQQRFAFVRANGLAAVAEVARAGKSFRAGPRGRPLGHRNPYDPVFTGHFAVRDVERYNLVVASTVAR
jgi:hypothetical protein